MATKRYINVEELKAVSRGSYEETIAALGELAQTNAAQLFGEDEAVSIVGTFPTLALVLSESGSLVRMFYERRPNGSLSIVRQESVELPIFVGEDVESYAQTRIREAVKMWRSGRIDEARKIISEAAPYVSDRPKVDEKKLVESAVAALRADRPWRLMLAQQPELVEAAEEEEWHPLEGLEPRFSLLYSGEIAESDLQEYRSTVLSKIEEARAKFEVCSKELTDCYIAAGSTLAEAPDDPAVLRFRGFATDLLSDLTSRCRVLEESRKTLARIYGLGRLYDAIVEDVNVCETACRFVRGMCERFTSAGP